MADLLEFLGTVKMFKDFEESELREVMRGLNRKSFKKDEIIAQEGKPGQSMFIIGEGQVRVSRHSESGARIVLALLGPGEIVGEMSLLDNSPRSADVVAATNCLVYEYQRDSMTQLSRDLHPSAFKLLWQISREACDRLRGVDTQMEHYLNNPDTLFEPALKEGVEPSTIKTKVSKLLKLFGG